MSSDAPRLVSWLACKTSKAEVILVSCGLTHPLWQRRPRLTGPRRTGTWQSLGHPMSYLSLNGSPGLPMATQLFCGFQCSPVTAAVAPPASPFSFLLLPPLPLWSVSGWRLPCFQRRRDPSQRGPELAVLSLERVSESRGDPGAPTLPTWGPPQDRTSP